MSQLRAESKIECVLPGHRIQMPIVHSLASLHSRTASRITWHSHDVFELLFLLDGATEYEFAGGQTVALPGGHFLMVRPGVRHRGLHDVRRPSRICSILLNRVEAKGNTNTIFDRKELERLLKLVENGTNLAWSMGAELRRLTSHLASQVREFDSERGDSAAALRLSVCGILLEMSRQLTSTRTIPPDEAVRAAIACMESKFDQTLSIHDVAKDIGCSRARLFEIFKEATGLTPNDYLQRLRVTRAATMLVDTSLSVTEIAMHCGFNTSQYFSSVFRKYHNQTPSEVRLARTVEKRRTK